MDWRTVRHIVLTVDRRTHPAGAYDAIRIYKTIPRLIRALKLSKQKWLWVLEFHADSYPHWHLLVESDRGMVGKRLIDSKWVWGHTWESYIQNRSHWQAIIGYHRGRGYLAGERKAHQLRLPDWLVGRSRVRKFGGHARNVSRGTPIPTGKKRAKSEPYRERFGACGEGSRIRIGCHWSTIDADAAIARGIADRYLGDTVGGSYEGDSEAIAYVMSQIKAAGATLERSEASPGG